MSTSIIDDSIAIDATKITAECTNASVDFVECECCGLTEECTKTYIETVRERYKGKWICGLCAEAVNEEVVRCDKQKLISPEEAMDRHINFCNKFRLSGPPTDPTRHLITAMTQVLRRSLESPKFVRSMPSSPTNSRGGGDVDGGLTRSERCIPSLSLGDGAICCEIDENCERGKGQGW